MAGRILRKRSLSQLKMGRALLAGSGKRGVCVVAVVSLEIIPSEMAIGIRMADHRLDGGAAPQLLFDDPKTPRF
jgi:hypothetical protein